MVYIQQLIQANTITVKNKTRGRMMRRFRVQFVTNRGPVAVQLAPQQVQLCNGQLPDVHRLTQSTSTTSPLFGYRNHELSQDASDSVRQPGAFFRLLMRSRRILRFASHTSFRISGVLRTKSCGTSHHASAQRLQRVDVSQLLFADRANILVASGAYMKSNC
jgi:hypothetical protein